MILTAVTMAIVLAIALIVVLNVLGAIDPGDIDSRVETAYEGAGGNTTSGARVTNATEDLQTNIETFFTVGPIVLIVIAAVGILSYVMLLRRSK